MRRRLRMAVVLAVAVSACATRSPPLNPNTALLERDTHVAARFANTAPDPNLDVWVLDVGQGLCVYIDCPDNVRPLLVDCGSNSWGHRNNASTVTRWLNDHAAAASPMAVAISHAHIDHYRALPQIDRANVESVTGGGPQSAYPQSVRTWAGSRMRTFSGRQPHYNDSALSCGPRTRVDILTVNAHNRNPPQNGDSLVVEISFGDTAVMLPGDAEGVTEAAALAALQSGGVTLPANVALISAHHGSSEFGSNSEAWLQRLHPWTMIFSANPEYRTYSHPRCEILDRAAGFVAPANAASHLTCDIDTKTSPQTNTTRARLLATYDNGTMRVRLTGSAITVACEQLSPACDEHVSLNDLPNHPGS